MSDQKQVITLTFREFCDLYDVVNQWSELTQLADKLALVKGNGDTLIRLTVEEIEEE